MILIERHLRLGPGGVVHVGVGRVQGYKAVWVSTHRVRSGALADYCADFSELKKSMREFSTPPETFRAARRGGCFES
jgi:hypothetical protein